MYVSEVYVIFLCSKLFREFLSTDSILPCVLKHHHSQLILHYLLELFPLTPEINLYRERQRSWNLVRINLCYLSSPLPILLFSLSHLIRSPSHLGLARLVSNVVRHRKTVGLHIIEVGMGGQPNGEYFL